MANQPYDNHSSNGGGVFNVPVAFDATSTPVVSPVAAGATSTLLVPAKAARLNLLVVGSNAATVTIVTGATAKAGSISIPANTQVTLDCAGMGFTGWPDGIKIVAGATSPVSFWFDCTTPDGK